MAPKISVIIPVYNISKYLEKCLWSVTNQTLREIEIIVVNDGSTDDSMSVIEKFAASDNRITVINKTNEGASTARRAGLEVATGTYIHHLDGDDYLELNCYQTLYEKACTTDADIITMKFWFEDPEANTLNESDSYEKDEVDNMEFLKHAWSTYHYFPLWHYIHKKSLSDSNPLRFQSKMGLGEDVFLTSQLVYYARKIANTSTAPLLHYMSRPQSVTNRKIDERKINDILLYPKLISDFMKDKPEYEDIKVYMYAMEVQSEGILLMSRHFKDAHKRCVAVMKTVESYPEIFKMEGTRSFRKLIKLFARSYILGRAYAQYYIMKGKIK